jgi:hypothetical protein
VNGLERGRQIRIHGKNLTPLRRRVKLYAQSGADGYDSLRAEEAYLG